MKRHGEEQVDIVDAKAEQSLRQVWLRCFLILVGLKMG